VIHDNLMLLQVSLAHDDTSHQSTLRTHQQAQLLQVETLFFPTTYRYIYNFNSYTSNQDPRGDTILILEKQKNSNHQY
jgi:hypothetical protein